MKFLINMYYQYVRLLFIINMKPNEKKRETLDLPPILDPIQSKRFKKILSFSTCDCASRFTWEKQDLLGKGGFADVYRIKMSNPKIQDSKKKLQNTSDESTKHDCDYSKQLYAAKIFPTANCSKGAYKRMKDEIRIHSQLDHPNLVKFITLFETNDCILSMMEYCSNKTLKEMLHARRRITDVESAFFLKQIISGVQYLHSLKTIHRDLKPGNIFLTEDMNIKIGDFGLSVMYDSNKYCGKMGGHKAGTPNYISPEILKNNGYVSKSS